MSLRSSSYLVIIYLFNPSFGNFPIFGSSLLDFSDELQKCCKMLMCLNANVQEL